MLKFTYDIVYQIPMGRPMLMLLLIIIPFIALLIYIGHYISRLDTYLNSRGFISVNNVYPKSAIVFGNTGIAKQAAIHLEKSNIPVFALPEPYILERDKDFRYLLALSDNDADNLLMCKIGRKIYGIENMISLCNDTANASIFASEDICYMTAQALNIKTLCDYMLAREA